MAAVDRARLAAMVDHTLLAPEATVARVEALCREAAELGVAAVCVNATMVTVAAAAVGAPAPGSGDRGAGTVSTVTGAVRGSGDSGAGSAPTVTGPGRGPAVGGAGRLVVASVVGFPSGAHPTEVKVAEARRAVADGAAELDVVIDLGAAAAGDWAAVEAELDAVRRAAPHAVLKVIVESALWTRGQLVAACAAAEAAGADMVKTSTGFHPAGGADVEAVATMAAAVGGRLGVKASGGIRDAATALAMVDAGATRLGCSATRAILDGL
ncbi:MAG: deoxyribose-phosphate aldolase [Acidimicrobiia bacterium]